MAANTSGGVRRAMWLLLIVTHVLGFCYANNAFSVEDVTINYMNCDYYDCDKSYHKTEYDDDGIGCIVNKIVLLKDVHSHMIGRIFQCVLNKCDKPLGLNVNKTMEEAIKEKSILQSVFEKLNMKIIDDCDCIPVGTYEAQNCLIIENDMLQTMSGRYFVTAALYDTDDTKFLDLDLYMKVE